MTWQAIGSMVFVRVLRQRRSVRERASPPYTVGNHSAEVGFGTWQSGEAEAHTKGGAASATAAALKARVVALSSHPAVDGDLGGAQGVA